MGRMEIDKGGGSGTGKVASSLIDTGAGSVALDSHMASRPFLCRCPVLMTASRPCSKDPKRAR